MPRPSPIVKITPSIVRNHAIHCHDGAPLSEITRPVAKNHAPRGGVTQDIVRNHAIHCHDQAPCQKSRDPLPRITPKVGSTIRVGLQECRMRVPTPSTTITPQDHLHQPTQHKCTLDATTIRATRQKLTQNSEHPPWSENRGARPVSYTHLRAHET